jgi:hypothetical protein
MKMLIKYTRILTVFLFALLFTGGLSLFLTGCADDDVTPPPPVVAGFTHTLEDDQGTVRFLNTSENADTYAWNFGDGTSSTEENPVKKFASGTYTVVLTATSGTLSNTFSDEITILVREGMTLPANFDNSNVDYIATTFNGATFAIVDNPAPGGSNNVASKVGAVTNSGANFEGLFFDLASPINFATEDKTITMNFWSDAPIAVLLKLEEGTEGAIEVATNHGGTGWEDICFDFSSTAQYSRLTLFVDGPGTTAGTFYFDNIRQSELIDKRGPVITLNGAATINLTVGDSFTDPGATAADNVDGDVSANIVVGGDAVDTNTEGTYVITYNVSDAAGNAAAEVTRTVIVNAVEVVPFDDGLLTNGDFEAGASPWTIGVGTDPVPLETTDGNTYYSVNVATAGNSFDVNMSQKVGITAEAVYILSFDAWSNGNRSIVAGIGLSADPWTNVTEIVAISATRTTYTYTFTARGFGASDARVIFDLGSEVGLVNIDNVSLFLDTSAGDTTPPVITLNGAATINLTVGGTFTDPGAIATDNVDGDISANIVVGGDAVNTGAAGTYIITYNVSDAAGNAATQVTRTVIVAAGGGGTFDDGLLTNGDFEAGAAPWTIGVGSDPVPVVTTDGNTYYSRNVETAGNAFDVNMSQRVAITADAVYTLSFDAWSDRERSIVAGIGLSADPWSNTVETVAITTTRTTYTYTLTANGFGAPDARVIFDIGAAVGLVNIDNVSLFEDTSGGDITPPVITLIGGASIGVVTGGTFTDPGATAIDNVDGDITSSIIVGGDAVNVNTNGTYVITYTATDAAGNSTTVSRTVTVSATGGAGNLAANGDFENGATGWVLFQNGGSASIDNTQSNGGGTASGRLATGGASNPAFKQERFGIGTVQAGDVVEIKFDHKGTIGGEGGVFNVLLFVEVAEGQSGNTITHVFDPRPALGADWSTFTGRFTIPGNANVSGGISFLIEAVCGGAAGCTVEANIDNVEVTLNP